MTEFKGHPLEIQRRAFQRTIGVTVKPTGLIKVTAGKTASMGAIRSFLRESNDWLDKVLHEYHSLRSKYPPKQYLQGEGFLYLGRLRHLNYRMSYQKRLKFEVDNNELSCFVPSEKWNESFVTYPQPQLKKELIKFYEKQGREILASRIGIFSEKMELFPSAVSFRSQKTRWGSCSSQGRISLNWRLIAAPIETLDYVVIHELAHLKIQNHSKAFWGLVSRYSTEYKRHRQWLRDHQYEFDFLAKNSELHNESQQMSLEL